MALAGQSAGEAGVVLYEPQPVDERHQRVFPLFLRVSRLEQVVPLRLVQLELVVLALRAAADHRAGDLAAEALAVVLVALGLLASTALRVQQHLARPHRRQLRVEGARVHHRDISPDHVQSLGVLRQVEAGNAPAVTAAVPVPDEAAAVESHAPRLGAGATVLGRADLVRHVGLTLGPLVHCLLYSFILLLVARQPVLPRDGGLALEEVSISLLVIVPIQLVVARV